MVICLHEEHAVSIADGYGKVTEEPMAVALHANVGLMHAAMPIFNAWCDRTPMMIFGATGPVDAHRRRPWIDWIHTSKDQASIIRDYTKWDDQPASPQAAVESVLRANQITRSAPYGPVYICLDAGLQEAALSEEISIPDAARFAPAPSAAVPRVSLQKAIESHRKAKFPLILAGRVSRKQADWDNRVRFAEAIGAAVLTSSNDPSAFPTTHPLHLAAPCLRPSANATALIKQADLIISLDWLDLAGVLRLSLGVAQTSSSRGKDHPPLLGRQHSHQWLEHGSSGARRGGYSDLRRARSVRRADDRRDGRKEEPQNQIPARNEKAAPLERRAQGQVGAGARASRCRCGTWR